MRRFGYLEKGPTQAEALYSGEAIIDAIKHVQKFGALPQTGVLDRRTIEVRKTNNIQCVLIVCICILDHTKH